MNDDLPEKGTPAVEWCMYIAEQALLAVGLTFINMNLWVVERRWARRRARREVR